MIVGSTASARRTGARSTQAVPSGKASATYGRAAASSTRLVLPTPPGPVTVTSRTSSRSSRSCSSLVAATRPTSAPMGGGGAVSRAAARAGTSTGPVAERTPAASRQAASTASRSVGVSSRAEQISSIVAR